MAKRKAAVLLKLGDRVQVLHHPRMRGKIVELRGPLGHAPLPSVEIIDLSDPPDPAEAIQGSRDERRTSKTTRRRGKRNRPAR